MANILTRLFNPKREERYLINQSPTDTLGLPYANNTSRIAQESALRLSVVYRCVDVISDAIASQTWEHLQYNKVTGWSADEMSDIAYMLNVEPSVSMSRFILMKTIVSKMLLEGNGYIRVHRLPNGHPYELELIRDNVKVYLMNDRRLYYVIVYSNGDQSTPIPADDIIHILNYTYDGLIGVSTLTHATNSLSLAQSAESSAKGFFSSGANMSGILSVTGKLTPEKALAIKDSWAKAFSITEGQPGGIAVMEGGLEFKPVTVNPKDAQMLETRQFNVIDICRFFGVSPSKVFDSSNLTYSNIESFQLGFITDTISPLDSKIEAEVNRKLLRPSQRKTTKLNLNLSELLRGNMDSTANYYTKMLSVGAYTPNQIRNKIGQPKVEGGDKSYVPLNLIPVDTPITQNKKIDKNLNIKDDEPKQGNQDNN